MRGLDKSNISAKPGRGELAGYYARGKHLHGNGHASDIGWVLSKILRNQGNVYAARAAIETAVNAADPWLYLMRLANGRRRIDDDEEAARARGDTF